LGTTTIFQKSNNGRLEQPSKEKGMILVKLEAKPE
jgi:hypothetical protein